MKRATALLVAAVAMPVLLLVATAQIVVIYLKGVAATDSSQCGDGADTSGASASALGSVVIDRPEG